MRLTGSRIFAIILHLHVGTEQIACIVSAGISCCSGVQTASGGSMVCCKIDHGTLCRYTITIGTVPLEQVLHSIHIRFHKGILVQRQSAVIFHSDADLRQLLTVGNGSIPQRFRAVVHCGIAHIIHSSHHAVVILHKAVHRIVDGTGIIALGRGLYTCLLYTSPSPRDS